MNLQQLGMKLREYTEGDYEGVWALHQKTVLENDGFVKNLSFHTDFDNILQTYEVFFVAHDNNTIVGMVGVKRIDTMTLEMKRLQVAASYQGKGLGRMLIEKVFDYTRSSIAKFLRLDVSAPQVKARNIYLSLGFNITHVDERVLGPDNERFTSTYMEKEF